MISSLSFASHAYSLVGFGNTITGCQGSSVLPQEYVRIEKERLFFETKSQ
jgi:hypothetical protein